jgi:hypothetical protein
MKALKENNGTSNPEITVILILEEKGELSTAEIVQEASKMSKKCKDSVPWTLISLEKKRKISKKLSKQKKGYVWYITNK